MSSSAFESLQSRARSARVLAVGAPLFALVIATLVGYRQSMGVLELLVVGAVAAVPLWILAYAFRSRRRDGTWRFGARDVRALAIVVVVLVAVPAVWWFVAYGSGEARGVNCVLGCAMVAVPVSLPFVLALGLALAVESAGD